jgi:hypothetical protein
MTRNRLGFLAITIAVALGCAALAQDAPKKDAPKEGAKKASGGILQPGMTPTAGSYDAPHGKLGDKADKPWSTTTIEAAVDGKPRTGKLDTVIGEIIDFSCYPQLGKHGDKHRDCAQKCFRAGMPIGLLAKDGSVYLLTEEEHHPRRDGQTNFRDAAIEHAGHIMEVNGTLATLGGYKVLYVAGFKK